MKHLKKFFSFLEDSISESLTENRWPSDWKKMPEWKRLEELGFYDATTPLQAKNNTIMLKNSNPRLSHFYPAGIVLQQSGYIRDKGQRSGFIKSLKTSDWTLKDLLDHVLKSASREFSRVTSGSDEDDLTQDQIDLINRSTKSRWKFNKETGEVDVQGVVTIVIKSKADEIALNSMKFGRARDFNLRGFKDPIMKFLPTRVDGQLSFLNCGLKNLKQVTTKCKELYLGNCHDLKSLEGLIHLLPLKMFVLDSVSAEPATPEKILQLVENGFTWESGGRTYNYFDADEQKQKERATRLFLSALTPESLAPYFKNNPTQIYMLNDNPKLKSEVLKISGIRDLSNIGEILARKLY